MADSQPTVERPSLFRRSKTLLSTAYSTVTSTSTRSGIKSKTPSSVIEAETEERAARYKKDDQYERVTTMPLERGTQGDIGVRKSKTSGNLFAVKHTVARVADPIHRARHDGDRPHKLPGEALIAKDIVPPHPNIVAIHDYFENPDWPGRYYIFMHACTGGDLHEQIHHWRRRGQITPKLFVYHLTVQICDAFAFLHHGLRHTKNGCYTQDEDFQAVVHGDIKFENFMLDWNRQNVVGGLPDVVVGDFGHAKLLSDPEPKVDCGTEGWQSPSLQALYEQYRSKQNNLFLKRAEKFRIYYNIGKSRTLTDDVYSLGLLFATAANEAPERCYPSWPVGQDEELLSLSKEHGLRDVVYGCLRVDPTKRASMDFGEKGVLSEVNRLRMARDRMVAQGVKLDPTDWFRMPAPISTTASKKN